jgi:hypothetical protein
MGFLTVGMVAFYHTLLQLLYHTLFSSTQERICHLEISLSRDSILDLIPQSSGASLESRFH